MKEINGIENEFEFVKYLNRKRVIELNPIFRDLIDRLFKRPNENLEITCWKNHFPQKADIFVKINGVMKGISIKKGSRNSLHVDRLSDFTKFLVDNNISKNIINKYLKYHFADGTLNGCGIKRLSADEYKITHPNEIDLINSNFNQEKILKNAIDRFVLKGNNSKYTIDAIVYGEVNNFLWITREDIYKIILLKNDYSSAVHFGPLTIQPKARCLNYNSKYERDRFCVQVKWYSLFDDIIYILNQNSADCTSSNCDTKKTN